MRQCPTCGKRFLADHERVCDADGAALQEVIVATDRDRLVGAVVLDRFRIEAVIGDGGMGVVYRAVDTRTNTPYALKVLRAEYSKDDDLVMRFEQEAEAMRKVHHPNVVEMYQFAKLPDDSRVYVMEILEGRSLKQLMAQHAKSQKPHKRKGLPEHVVLHIAGQMCDGLQAAHEAGIVHRDMKPDNVFLVRRGEDENFVKILDFGIAKVLGSSARTQTGSVFGTPHYMSPEQAGGQRDIDPRTDVYALGILMYEMSTCRVPFDADNLMGVLTAHLYHPAVPPREHREGAHISDGLEAIILRALAKRREVRYASAQALRDDLDRLARGETPRALLDAEPITAKVGKNEIDGVPGTIPPSDTDGRTVRVSRVRTSVPDAVAAASLEVRDDVPAPSSDPGDESAGVAEPAIPAVPVSTDRSIPPLTTGSHVAPARSSRSLALFAVVGVVTLGAIVGVAVFGVRQTSSAPRAHDSSAAPASLPVSLPSTPPVVPSAAQGAEVPPVVPVAPTGSGAANPGAEPSGAAQRPNGVSAFVSLESDPSGARVYQSAVPIGDTPMLVARPFSGSLIYTVVADGREPQQVVVASDHGPASVRVTLHTRGPARPGGSTRPAGTATNAAGGGRGNPSGGSATSGTGGTSGTNATTGSGTTGNGTQSGRNGELYDPWANGPRRAPAR